MKVRNTFNEVRSIFYSAMKLISTSEGIKREAVNYFQNILGYSTSQNFNRVHILSSLEGFQWNEDQLSLLNLPVLSREIKDTLFSLNNDKAPSPDGFTPWFFKEAWSIHNKLLGEVNATIIALVPKVSNPSSMGDFRPISCCNTIYKCISKIIANRLKPCLPDLICPNQSASINGRKISDNILLAQELLKNYHRRGGPPRCAIKVDLMKAYDSVNWDFIVDTLTTLNTSVHLVN
ncbi:hypothetical protein L1049_018769 [Liquidambar formosana]|uniref:Reverse transcriptase domain-containing protein n=1 Tax=Liquidambar formosana TaxID=63359 RepID=A0AAP0RAI8_LIQFO